MQCWCVKPNRAACSMMPLIHVCAPERKMVWDSCVSCVKMLAFLHGSHYQTPVLAQSLSGVHLHKFHDPVDAQPVVAGGTCVADMHCSAACRLHSSQWSRSTCSHISELHESREYGPTCRSLLAFAKIGLVCTILLNMHELYPCHMCRHCDPCTADDAHGTSSCKKHFLKTRAC